MEKIGYFILRNNGGFVCAPACIYLDQNGKEHRASDGHNIALGQTSEKYDPSAHGVSNGFQVKLYVDVKLGEDCQAESFFIYESGNKFYAEYDITGTTLNNNLHFDGIKEGK